MPYSSVLRAGLATFFDQETKVGSTLQAG